MIDDYGLVRSVTDERGNTASYDYDDLLGRLTSVTYPHGDFQAWAPISMSFARLIVPNSTLRLMSGARA